MAVTPTIKAPQARALVVNRAESPDVLLPSGRGLSVINFPSLSLRTPQARTLPVMTQAAQIEIPQARVLVVARGKFERPHVRAWSFTLDGHDFYVLRLPGETLVCDVAQGKWHIWGSGDDALWRAVTGITWQRSLAAANNYGSNILVGDDTFGTVYFLNPEGQVDDNPDSDRAAVPFQRVVVGQIALRGRAAAPCWGVELYGSIGEQGTDDYDDVQLLTSDDGHNYDDQGTQSITSGDYTARLDWPSLGQMQAPGRLIKIVDYGALVRIDGLETPDAEPK